MVGQDEVTESLLNQLRGDADKYQVMKLGQLVFDYKFIENVDQLEMTSGIENTIYIPKDVGNSQAIDSKLAIVDGDITSSKIHTQIDNERTRLERWRGRSKHLDNIYWKRVKRVMTVISVTIIWSTSCKIFNKR